MKPDYEKIIELPEKSFSVKLVNRENRPLLSQAWHYHPEIEICLTLKSKGQRFVGNKISNYQTNDLIMFGSNLPHGFITNQYCSQVVIQMLDNFMGNEFITKPELQSIKSLFERSKRGLVFNNEAKKKIKPIIQNLIKENGFQQFLHLLDLLNTLAEDKEVEAVCSPEYILSLNNKELGRIKIVYDHIVNHFTEDVNIKKIADKLNITEAGFYKYIKKHTHKNYTQILNEFRINYASKLLMTTDKTIFDICFECGFNNLSYFNRKFKEIIQETPHKFKKKYNS